MAGGKQGEAEPKRLNRFAGAGEALTRALDPVFRKRGFAGRDIVTRWSAIAPSPYDRVAAPDRLVWPRGDRGAGGATLYLRCAQGHALALSHEGDRIAEAVNRYFGYVLVSTVRLSAEPFVPQQADDRPPPPTATPPAVEAAVSGVDDTPLRDALRRLGSALARPGRKG